MEEEQGEPIKVIKNLAACNQTIRHRALKLLTKTWLPNQTTVSEEDMKKIWKGLFYTLWHADKSPLQSDLATSLSSLLLSLPLPLSLHYFSSFLLTIRREWPGIDFYRLDKFYLLIRRFVHYMFELMKKHSWDLELVKKIVRVLDENSIFVIDEGNGSNGVNYHIANVFLEELKPFWPIRLEALEVLFRPFVDVLSKSKDKILVGKVKVNVFDVLVEKGKRLLDLKSSVGEVDESDDVVVFGTIGLKLQLSSSFLELGSSEECVQANRKVLFSLHDDFLLLEKRVLKSYFAIEIPATKNEDNNDEVPSLVPMDVDDTKMNVSNGAEDEIKKSKKIKKAKKGSESKGKKKRKRDTDAPVENATKIDDNSALPAVSREEKKGEPSSDSDLLTHNETVISNLRMQFEKVAAEAGLNEDCTGISGSLESKANGVVKNKRKRAKSMDGKTPSSLGVDDAAKSGEKSEKKVRFAMKNNLVWNPGSPLPDQSVRIPPSVTPKGSALKKGVPPGPIRNVNKKVKRAGSVKKKIPKTIKGIKQMKKIKIMSI